MVFSTNVNGYAQDFLFDILLLFQIKCMSFIKDWSVSCFKSRCKYVIFGNVILGQVTKL